MINVGDNNINVYVGDTEVSVYAGDELIYPLNFGELTAITITNLTWVTDISWRGGTGTSANCTYLITGYYDSGKTRKLNSKSTVLGEITASSTTSETRDLIGTLVLTATCSGLSATGSVDAYQEKYSPKIWVALSSITNTVPFDAIAWSVNYTSIGDGWVSEVSGLSTQNRSWVEGLTAEWGWYGVLRWSPPGWGNTYSFSFKHQVGYYAEDVTAPRSGLTQTTIEVSGQSVTVNLLELSQVPYYDGNVCYGAYSSGNYYASKAASGAVYVRING